MTESGDVLVVPTKTVRLCDMIRSILDEVHAESVDEPLARARLAAVYAGALVEVGSTLSDSLLEELAALQTPRIDGSSSIDELRVAIAQLAGWVLGLLLGTGVGLIDAQLPDVDADGEPDEGEGTG